MEQVKAGRLCTTERLAFQIGIACKSATLALLGKRVQSSRKVGSHRSRRWVANTTSNSVEPKKGPQTPRRLGGALTGDPHAPKHRVTIRNWRGDESLTVEVPEDRYIWWYFREQGYELPSSCLNGCCTTCAAKVLRGTLVQPEALGLTRDFRDKGYCLLCVSYPRSELEVVLQDEDEVYQSQWATTFESGGKRWGGFLPEED
jgi:ferredoxin